MKIRRLSIGMHELVLECTKSKIGPKLVIGNISNS